MFSWSLLDKEYQPNLYSGLGRGVAKAEVDLVGVVDPSVYFASQEEYQTKTRKSESRQWMKQTREETNALPYLDFCDSN